MTRKNQDPTAPRAADDARTPYTPDEIESLRRRHNAGAYDVGDDGKAYLTVRGEWISESDVREILASAPTVESTGRTVHVWGPAVPAYRGEIDESWPDLHDRVVLPDGTVCLVSEYGGYTALWLHALCVDYGGNEYERRSATEDLTGINRRGHRGVLPTRISYDGLVGVLEVSK